MAIEHEPVRTPHEVWDALGLIAHHMRFAGYVECIVAPTGGASFLRTTTYDDKMRLYNEIERLNKHNARLKARIKRLEADLFDAK